MNNYNVAKNPPPKKNVAGVSKEPKKEEVGSAEEASGQYHAPYSATSIVLQQAQRNMGERQRSKMARLDRQACQKKDVN